MPAKSMCPRCGGKLRSPNHLCIPSAIEAYERRKAVFASLQSPKK